MQSRPVNQVLRYALVVGCAVVCILLFLLASASANSEFLGRYYGWLIGLIGAVAFVLLAFVAVALGRLYSRHKAGKFGSRLMARLVLLFAGIGILPGVVIFMVSVNFVSHSIDSWFDVKIESAIESGLNLGRAALDESLAELGATAQTAAATLAGQGDMSAQPVLARLLADTSGLQSAMLVDEKGAVLAAALEDRGANLAADAPNERRLKSAAMPGGYALAEGGVDRDLSEEGLDASRARSTPSRACACAWCWPCPSRPARRSATCSCCSRCRSTWPRTPRCCVRPTANTACAWKRARACARCISGC